MKPAAVGLGVGAAVGGAVAWASRGPTLVEWPAPVRRAFPFVLGGIAGLTAGVKVGTVTDLELNPQTFFADAEISLRKDVILPDDSVILIASEGLLGGAFVEIIPGGSLTNLEPGEEILDTQGAVSMLALMMKFAGGGSEDGQ